MVNQTLFGLQQQRYDALLTLLVQLRQPQLSKRPNMTALNAALTEALPPLPAAVIADVAEAMRTLERERQTLTDLQQARDAVADFGRSYASYAAIATLRRADDVRRTTATYEETGRKLLSAQRDRDAAAVLVERLTAEVAGLRNRVSELAAREQTLRESPEMRDATRLEQARQRATETRAQADQAARHLKEATERLADHRRRRTEAEAADAEAAEAVQTQRAAVGQIAARAGLGPQSTAGDTLAQAISPPGDEAGAASILRRRADAIEHVANVTRAAAQATQAHTTAKGQLDTAITTRDSLDDAHRSALEEQERRREEWVRALRTTTDTWTALVAHARPSAEGQAPQQRAPPGGRGPDRPRPCGRCHRRAGCGGRAAGGRGGVDGAAGGIAARSGTLANQVGRWADRSSGSAALATDRLR